MSNNEILRRLNLIICGLLLCVYEVTAQQFNAQSDLFDVLQNSCYNYLDVSENDNLNGLAITQIQILSQPVNGGASVNGNFFTYCSNPGYVGIDLFKYQISAGGQLDSATVYLNVTGPNNQVFAGDADQNGLVEHFDVLTIGLGHGLLGPSKDSNSNASLAWAPVPWLNSDPGAADCDGSGIVDDLDVSTVEANYLDSFSVGQPHLVDTSTCASSGFPLMVESLSGDSIDDGDTMEILIKLGEEANQSEAYGIAFTLEFDNGFVDGNNATLSTGNSWLLQNDNGLFFSKSFQSEGKIDIVLTKTNHIEASGNGEILSAIFPIDDNIDGIAVAPGWHNLQFKVRRVRVVNAYNVVQSVCVQEKTFMVHKLATAIPYYNDLNISIHPNPTQRQLLIHGQDLEEVRIVEISGREIIYNRSLDKQEYVKLDLAVFKPGIYLVTVKTSRSFITKKIIIQ